MSDRTDDERLDDIRRYAADAIENLGHASYADFLNDANLQYASFYLMAIIGEAASKTADTTRRRYPAVSWRLFRGLRNVLIHEYHSVEPNRIYRAVAHDLPMLIAGLEMPAR